MCSRSRSLPTMRRCRRYRRFLSVSSHPSSSVQPQSRPLPPQASAFVDVESHVFTEMCRTCWVNSWSAKCPEQLLIRGPLLMTIQCTSSSHYNIGLPVQRTKSCVLQNLGIMRFHLISHELIPSLRFLTVNSRSPFFCLGGGVYGVYS